MRCIRFGEIPEDEKSNIFDGDLGTIGKEEGVSCYEAIYRAGVYNLLMPSVAAGAIFDMAGLVEEWKTGKRKCFVIDGIFCGRGSHHEPLLKDIVIVDEITPDPENMNHIGIPFESGDHRPYWPGEICKNCLRPNVVGYVVEDDVWEKIHSSTKDGILCPQCFDQRAYEMGVKYNFVETFPISWSDWEEKNN